MIVTSDFSQLSEKSKGHEKYIVENIENSVVFVKKNKMSYGLPNWPTAGSCLPHGEIIRYVHTYTSPQMI